MAQINRQRYQQNENRNWRDKSKTQRHLMDTLGWSQTNTVFIMQTLQALLKFRNPLKYLLSLNTSPRSEITAASLQLRFKYLCQNLFQNQQTVRSCIVCLDRSPHYLLQKRKMSCHLANQTLQLRTTGWTKACTTIQTGYANVHSVTCLNEDKIWTHNWNHIKCFNIKESILQTIKTKLWEVGFGYSCRQWWESILLRIANKDGE